MLCETKLPLVVNTMNSLNLWAVGWGPCSLHLVPIREGGGSEGVSEYNDKVGIATCILVIQVRGERRYIHVCEKEQ